MSERILQEIEILKKFYSSIEFNDDKNWALIPSYRLPTGYGWGPEIIPVCLMIPNGYPGTNPYGIYVPSDIKVNGQVPGNFNSSPGNLPPFKGSWGILSWTLDPWKPSADIQQGSNLLNFVQSFYRRFQEGI